MRRLAGDQGGFTLVELLVATLLLLLVSAPLATVLTSAAVVQRLAAQRTGAEQLAAAQVERIRATPYDSVGLQGGNPPGLFQALQQTSVGGVGVRLQTQIAYVDDHAPGTFQTYADYKHVVVTVTRGTDGRQLAQKSTYVSSTGAAPFGGVNQVTIKARVIDSALAAPVPGATVNLATGPSAPRADTTDPAGSVIFPALAANPSSGPQAYYDLTVAASGYVTYPGDTPPGAAAHVQLAPGQTWSTAIRVYRPGTTLGITLYDATGRLYTGTATVTVGASWGGQTFTFTGGALQVTQLNGVPLVPGVQYSISAWTPPGNYANAVTTLAPSSYPTVMTASASLTLSATTYPTKTLTVKVQTTGGVAVSGATVQVSGGPVDTYFYGTTNSAGQASFSVPTGSTAYTVAVSSAAGSGSGSAVVGASSVTLTVTVQ